MAKVCEATEAERVDFCLDNVSKYVVLCKNHFDDDAFMNLMAWQMNFAKQLGLIHGAVPTRDTVTPAAASASAAPSQSSMRQESLAVKRRPIKVIFTSLHWP